MKIHRSLANILLIIAPYLIQTSFSLNGKLTSTLFLNSPPDAPNLKNSTELRKFKQAEIDSNATAYAHYMRETIKNVQNFTQLSHTKQQEIKQWLTEQYLEESDFDQEAHRLNIIEKCVFANPDQPTVCWECVEGYGPYPVTPANWECRKCNVTIDKCDKCLWIMSYQTEPPSMLYGC
jgi:hypothetical protein